tara:strand:+ start:78 stop:317 length:240 start_codon:yes stop_codon:yes gene_type:complete
MFKPITWDVCHEAIIRNNKRNIKLNSNKKDIVSHDTFIEFLETIYKDYENNNVINEWIINFGLLDIAISYSKNKKNCSY